MAAYFLSRLAMCLGLLSVVLFSLFGSREDAFLALATVAAIALSNIAEAAMSLASDETKEESESSDDEI